MAETIRGISVRIGAETTGLQKALKDVNKQGRNISQELRQVNRLLKFNPGDTKLLAQQQELLAKQVDNSREKLDRLKASEQQVRDQFSKGEISEGQMRAFERELVKTESQLKHYESQLTTTISKTEQFAKKMQEAGEKLQSAGKKMSSVGKNLSTKLTAPIMGVGAALTGIATKSAEATDRVDKMSQKLGVSRQAFQELDFILSQNGMNIDTLQTGMKTLSDAAVEASKGTKTYAEAFDTLGISVTDTNGNMKSQEEILYESITALQDMEDKTTRTAVANDLFGRSATELAPLLNAGAGSMEALTEMAHELGLVLEDNAIDAGVSFTDTMDQIKRSMGAAATQVGVALMPAFESIAPVITNTIVPAVKSLADRISGLITWFSNLSPVAQKIALAIAGIATAAGPVLVVMGSIVSAIGTLLPLLGAIGTAIAGISAPVVAVVAGIAAFAAIAIEVYRNWDEVKTALINIWELIKASAKGLVTNIQLGFTKMKATILEVVDAIISKLSVLEKLPFGVGEKFAGLGDSIGEAAEKARAEVDKLAKEAEANGQNISKAVDGTKVAFGDMGTAIADDVKGVIASITGQTDAIEEGTYEQVEIVEDGQKQQSTITLNENQYRTDVTAEEEEEQTEIVEEEAQKRAELREKFEQKWNDKLFDLTSTRLEQLEKEKQEELLKAEELGADKTAIVEFYALKRQEILDAEAEKEEEREQKRLDTLAKFEQDWANKLFESTATNLELLEKEKNEALAKAEELGADKADILAYYALKEQEIIDERNAETDRKRQEEIQKELEAQQEKERIRTEFEQSWTQKLFQQTATRAEILEAEKQQALAKAEELGVSKTAIIQYYANEEQRIRDEQRQKEKEAAEKELEEKQARAEKERQIVQETAKSWTDSYMEIINSMVEGGETIGEILKEIVVNVINALEKQVIATQMAELAKAWAQSWWDWSAVGRALAAIASSTAAFEGAKELVRGLETGGVVAGGSDQLFRLGDGKEDEAVVPLNERVLSQIGAGIAANMPQQKVAAAGGGGREIHLHIGTLVADDFGLKKLERKLQTIRIGEAQRRGSR